MADASAINLRVVRQGAVRVSEAHVHRSGPGIVCIYVDLHSKRAEKLMVTYGADGPPSLYLVAGPQTLHLDESVPRDLETVVEFPDYVGWEVFSCSDPARYTVALTLVAPEEPTVGAPRHQPGEPMGYINERWVAIDGSVHTEAVYTRKAVGCAVKYRPCIASFVGQMVAEHVVRLHNASLASAFELPPPHDSLEEAQRAAGIWPQEAEPATVRVPSGPAPGMPSVMQPQGSSLPPAEIGQPAAVTGGRGKPCGCGKAAP